MPDSNYKMDNHLGGRKNICQACSIDKQQHCVFYTKNGNLTRYAFSCGYIEKRGSISLEKEHHSYHVKGFAGELQDTRIWESFHTLSEARKFFRTFPKNVKALEVAA